MTYFDDKLGLLVKRKAFVGIQVGNGWLWGALIEEDTDHVVLQDDNKLYLIRYDAIRAIEYRNGEVD